MKKKTDKTYRAKFSVVLQDYSQPGVQKSSEKFHKRKKTDSYSVIYDKKKKEN